MVLHPLTLSLCRHWGDYLSSLLSVLVSLCLSLSVSACVSLCVCVSVSLSPSHLSVCHSVSVALSGTLAQSPILEGKTPNLGSGVRDEGINSTGLRACFKLKPSGPNPLMEGGSLRGHLAYWCTGVWKLSTSNFLLLGHSLPSAALPRGRGGPGQACGFLGPAPPLLSVLSHPHFEPLTHSAGDHASSPGQREHKQQNGRSKALVGRAGGQRSDESLCTRIGEKG